MVHAGLRRDQRSGLVVERGELGYAAFPVLAVALNRAGRGPARLLPAIALASLVLLVGASVVLGFADRNVTGRVTILRMFPAFVAGAALAAHAAANGGARPAWPGARAGTLCTLSLIAVAAACSIPGLAVLTILPVAGLVLGLSFEQGPVDRFMASAPVLWLGKISFSLYLTHFTTLGLLLWAWPAQGAPPGPAADVALMASALAAILAVAAAFYYGCERPVARWVKASTGRLARAGDGVAADGHAPGV